MNKWIFGYGSLIWNPDFDFEQKQIATLQGWSRKFWQGSEDHRGVPGAPGRVVTLIPDPTSFCVGMAYLPSRLEYEKIMRQLDIREKGGYEQIESALLLTDGSAVDGITYIASQENPVYLGEASIDVIAAQIVSSCGPSGQNSEYLLELASAFRHLEIDDEHVFALETRVRQLMSD